MNSVKAASLLLVFVTVGHAGLECPLNVIDEQVHRVSRLRGDAQRNELRALLLDDTTDRLASYFYYSDQLSPALRALVADTRTGGAATSMLGLFADPKDVRAVIQAPPTGNDPFWAYPVVASLLHPETEEEWAFLRNCAFGKYRDNWVQSGAIQSLQLIASARSREILQAVQRENPEWAHRISRAIEYIDSGAAPLSDADLRTAAERLAQALQLGKWHGDAKTKCNVTGTRALVNLTFARGWDRLVFTASFAKTNGVWTLRGVSETMQQLTAPFPLVLTTPPR